MPVMQLRTQDDGYALSRLDYGAIDAGTTSAQIGFLLYNDKPTHVTGELLGTGDGSKVSFATAFKPLINDTNATIAVKVDGTAASGVTIDHSNGLIVFSAAPSAGAVVTVDYWYSVGSSDANSVVATVEQAASFAGDGSTHRFTLPTRCTTALKLLVAGVELTKGTEYDLQDNGDTLYITAAPVANATIVFSYVDAVCQAGYYEIRTSGIINELSRDGLSDAAESAFFKLGGVITATDKLIGTGDGSTVAFNTGTQLIKSISKITAGGTEITDYSVNNVTGKITFGTAPANAAEVRATYVYERGHSLGSIPQWCGRKCFLRATVPYDAPNSVLTTRIRVISQ